MDTGQGKSCFRNQQRQDKKDHENSADYSHLRSTSPSS